MIAEVLRDLGTAIRDAGARSMWRTSVRYSALSSGPSTEAT
jgi:hypothetical protein